MGVVRTVSVVLLVYILAQAASAYEISVLVFGPQGQPVPDASVWLTQDRIPKLQTTDNEGKCRFQEVNVGPVEIVAWKNGFAIGGRDASVVGSAEVAVALSEAGTLSAVLISHDRNPETGEEMQPQPVEGARVEAMLVNDAFTVAVDDLVDLGFPSERSDADGRLTLDYVPKGGHVAFRVSHRDFCDAYIHYPVGQREITVQMRPGVTLRGRVTNEAGEGIEHARVSIFRSSENDATLREFEEAVTGPDGFYSAMLPPGQYNVTAKHPEYATAAPVSGTLQPRDTDATCDLVLPTAFALAGRVVGTDDKPVGGVQIQYRVDNVVYEQTLTDNAGRFTLKVAPSEGHLHVEAPDGYMTGRGTDIDVTMGKSDVTLDEPIRLQVLPEIVGTVLDEAGAPVPQTFISTVGFEPAQFTLSDANGRFAIQLPKVPENAAAILQFEHPRRYLRTDVVIPLTDLKPIEVSLKPFDPDLSPGKVENVRNNELEGLRGKEAPPVECDIWVNVPSDTEGHPIAPTPEELRGHVIVLSFWGGFDRSERGMAHIRALNALYPIFQSMDDVDLVSVHDAGTEEYEMQEYIQDLDVRYPVGRDKDAETFDAYDIAAVPQVVLIDKKGVLRFYDVEGRLLELVKSLRREAP